MFLETSSYIGIPPEPLQAMDSVSSKSSLDCNISKTSRAKEPIYNSQSTITVRVKTLASTFERSINPTGKLEGTTNKVLKLKIPSSAILTWEYEGMPSIKVYPAYLKTEDKNKHLLMLFHHLLTEAPCNYRERLDHCILANYNILEISFKKKEHTVALHKNLDSQLTQNILRFLKEGRKNDSTYCCIHFHNEILGHPVETSTFLDPDSWTLIDLEDESLLNPGEGIAIYRYDEEKDHTIFLHRAVYLGQSLYLSLFGQTGPLQITLLEEMKKFYGGTGAARLKRKETAEVCLG